MGFFAGLWEYLTYIFWAIVPTKMRPDALIGAARVSADEGVKQVKFRQVLRATRWTLHVLIVLAVVVVLFWLNHVLDLDRVLRSPWPALHYVWLPFLFLLAYALFWLGWWLLKMLGAEPEAADFPDIARAWAEAQQALAAEGIEPTEAPLFLVVGRPAGSAADLFAAANLRWRVRHAPKGEAPLHVFAGPSGVFVTCEGASLLGSVGALLAPAKAAAEEAAEGPPRELAEESPEEPPPGGTNRDGPPQTNGAPAKAKVAVAVAAGGGGTEEEVETVGDAGLLPEEQEDDQALRVRQNRLLLLRHTAEVERQAARLKFLCRLIAKRRQPYCPVNGILLVLPYAATDNAADAAQAGELCRLDLAAAREGLRVHCPVQALVGDLETAVGFPELVRCFDDRQRQQLLGRRFPMLPLFPKGEESTPAMIDDGVRWLCQEMLPSLIYRQLRLEAPEGPTLPEAVADNGRLVQFLGEWRRRRPHLSRLLQQGLAAAPGEPALLSGCHLGATGPDPAGDQAFVHGVFRLLVEDQNYVFWTGLALADDRHYRLLTWLTCAVAALLAAALCTLIYLLWAA